MSRQEIMEKIADICKLVFEEPDLVVTEETTADDVEMWDSLTHVMLISEIEKAFKISFKFDEIRKAKNIGELCSMVEGK